MNKGCSVDECNRKHYGKGLCNLHWRRLGRTGTTDPSATVFRTPEESFQARIMPVTEAGCVIWTGRVEKHGHGQMRAYGKTTLAHRYAWERVNGPIPSGKLIDHMCHNASCVNVDHLRIATYAENSQNRRGPTVASKSGVRGVYWDGPRGKWCVQVTVGGKKNSGGYFTDKEEAGRVAARMRSELMPYSQN